MRPTCNICAFISSAENLIFLTNHWRVSLADDQAYLGRSYITLRKHKASLSELSSEEWQDFEALVKRLEAGYVNAFGSGTPFNWACMMNNAFQLPDPTPHVHWHVRPRHNQTITINGEAFTDPDYAHHYSRSRQQLPSADTLAAIISQIKANI